MFNSILMGIMLLGFLYFIGYLAYDAWKNLYWTHKISFNLKIIPF